MLASTITPACLRAKIILLLALSLVWTSSAVFAQDSVMIRFSPSGLDDDVINRGDFNNDGIPDIVTGNNAGNNSNAYGLSVYLGRGDGTFQNPKNTSAAVSPFDIAVGDFNGDGKLDVALAAYISSTQWVLQIMLGNGDGTFTKGQTVNLPSASWSITTGDFDNDGKLDLAIALDKVYLYKGAGNGTFSSAGSVKVGTQSQLRGGVRVGDFNGDGKTDIVVSDTRGLYVLWNSGSFTFSTKLVASSSFGIFARPVDVNQDHFTDLIVTYYTCNTGACTNWKVLLGNANKTFKQSAVMPLASEYQGFWGTTAADINGDGINDIVGLTNDSYVTSKGSITTYEVAVWLGNPDGSYQSTPLKFNTGTGSSSSDLVAGDFNRDGKVDLAVANPGYSNTVGLGVLLNATPRAACTPSTVSPSVTVCQPQDLIYSNSPVQWIADSHDTNTVNTMQIYVDNKLVVNSPSSSLNESLALTKGSHTVVTKAWDSTGANFRSDRNVTIYSGNPGETCPTPALSLTICFPTQNQTTTTSVHVFANSDSDWPITAVQVYIDNKLVFNDTSSSTYVDTAFTVSKGQHNIVVQTFDAAGRIFSGSRTINAQ